MPPTVTAYRVNWRQDGDWQSEAFGPDRQTQAQRFKLDVEEAGNRWPDGWIRGFGYPVTTTPEPAPANLPFLDYAMQHVRDKTGIQPDTRQRYANQATALAAELGAIVAADPATRGAVATIQNLTERHVARWVNARERTSAPKTIANWLSGLRRVAGTWKAPLSGVPDRTPGIQRLHAHGREDEMSMHPATFGLDCQRS